MEDNKTIEELAIEEIARELKYRKVDVMKTLLSKKDELSKKIDDIKEAIKLLETAKTNSEIDKIVGYKEIDSCCVASNYR